MKILALLLVSVSSLYATIFVSNLEIKSRCNDNVILVRGLACSSFFRRCNEFSSVHFYNSSSKYRVQEMGYITSPASDALGLLTDDAAIKTTGNLEKYLDIVDSEWPFTYYAKSYRFKFSFAVNDNPSVYYRFSCPNID